MNNARSADRLTAISGFDEYPGNPFGESDFTLEKDFAQLAAALRQIVLELCESSVTVTKQVDEGDGVFRPDPGWEFTGSVTTSRGDYSWVQPAPPPRTGPRTETTNEKGVATFQWDTSNARATSTLRLSEELKDGYDFVGAECTVTSTTQRRRRVVRQVSFTTPVGEVTVGPNQYASCTVRNRIRPGTIEIEKNATPDGAQAFGFTGSLGDFTLIDTRADGNASRIFANLTPGTYTVSELLPENWQLAGIACTPQTAGVIAGSQVTITLAPGGAVVCTYTDTRVNPPVPPEPPTPPTPPTPPQPPIPPEPPADTRLRVVKWMPRAARIGNRVPFRLTVINTGTVAARDVKMVDVPPASLALSALAADSRPRVGRGYALWRIGRLAPGARRTIRGSVRIQSGNPGRKRNLVFAAAVNARLVQDEADTRLRARGQGPVCVVASGEPGTRRASAAC